MNQAAKKLKMVKTIGTHSGTFHADETFACFMLLKTNMFAGADIVRSRDPAVLDKCDILVDVGGVYDPSKHRYDHHQRGFTETMEIAGKKYTTKLSSAGLIYRHFGREVIAKLCDWNLDTHKERVELLYQRLYDVFVEAFDGVDNGVSCYPDSVKPAYRDETGIAARVARLNPWWNQEFTDEILMTGFKKAIALTGEEFTERVRYYAFAWLPARDIVLKALQERHSVDKTGRIIKFEQSLPWKEHLFELEAEHKIAENNNILYVLYNTGDSCRVQAVPQRLDGFENRKSMPESWRGLRDQELSDKTGVPGCVFVHASGFIGGNKTEEGALEMARLAVAEQK